MPPARDIFQAPGPVLNKTPAAYAGMEPLSSRRIGSLLSPAISVALNWKVSNKANGYACATYSCCIGPVFVVVTKCCILVFYAGIVSLHFWSTRVSSGESKMKEVDWKLVRSAVIVCASRYAKAALLTYSRALSSDAVECSRDSTALSGRHCEFGVATPAACGKDPSSCTRCSTAGSFAVPQLGLPKGQSLRVSAARLSPLPIP